MAAQDRGQREIDDLRDEEGERREQTEFRLRAQFAGGQAADDDARFVAGEALIVDGGLSAAGPEQSRRFKQNCGRTARFVGITRGRTGGPPVLTKL